MQSPKTASFSDLRAALLVEKWRSSGPGVDLGEGPAGRLNNSKWRGAHNRSLYLKRLSPVGNDGSSAPTAS